MNYGVIGVGAVFENYQADQLFKVEGLNILAIADVNKERLEYIQRKYEIPYAYTDYHALLDRKDIQVIMVNLPQHMHVTPSIEATNAGKHLYVEKPLAVDLGDCQNIIESAKKNKVKLCVGHQRRFINVEQKAKKLIQEGYIGEIFKIRVIACWWEDLRKQPREWFRKFELALGGPLMRWGVHKMDTLRFLLDDNAVRVTAEKGLFVHKAKDITVEDNCVSLFRFSKGSIGILEVSATQWEPGPGLHGETIEIWGDKGTLWYRPSTGEMKLFSVAKPTDVIQGRNFLYTVYPPDNQEFVRIHTQFIKSIIEDTSPPVTGEDGYKAVEMVLASYQSAEKKEVVMLPLRK